MLMRKYEIEVESSDWVWSGEIEAETVEQAVDQAWNVLTDAIVSGAEIPVELGWMQLRDWQELPESRADRSCIPVFRIPGAAIR